MQNQKLQKSNKAQSFPKQNINTLFINHLNIYIPNKVFQNWKTLLFF